MEYAPSFECVLKRITGTGRAHDQAQSLHAVHAGHFQIEGDDVGAKLFDLFQSEFAVHRRADHFDRGIAGENRRG